MVTRIHAMSPPRDCRDTYLAEVGKVEYWFGKMCQRKSFCKEMLKKSTKDVLNSDGEYMLPPIFYESPSGNKWIGIVTISPSGRFYMAPILYYETDASIGCVTGKYNEHEGKDYYSIDIYTPHFFYQYGNRVETDINVFTLIRYYTINHSGVSPCTLKKNQRYRTVVVEGEERGTMEIDYPEPTYLVRTFYNKDMVRDVMHRQDHLKEAREFHSENIVKKGITRIYK